MCPAWGLRTQELKKPFQVPASYGRWEKKDAADLKITQDGIRRQPELARRKKVDLPEQREENPCRGPEAG